MRLYAIAFLIVLGLVGGAAIALEKFTSAENLLLRLGSFELRIPRLALEETPLTQQELAALFAKETPLSLAERLARFTAERARLPEAQGQSAVDGKMKEFIFKDILLEHVLAGRVGALRASRLDETLGDDKAQSVAARYENLTASGLTLTGLARLLEDPHGGDESVSIADAAALEKLTVTANDGALSLAAARLSTRRPRLAAFSDPALRRATGEAQDRIALVKEVVAAVSFETLEAQDLSLSGAPAPADPAFSLGARDLAFEGLEKGVARKARLAHFDLKSADGGRIALEGATFEGLDIGAALTHSGLRALHFDKARLEKLAGDAPAPDGRGRSKFALESATLDLGHFRDGAPTKAAARFQSLSVDLAARGEETNAEFLRSLGYSTLEFSGAGAAEWREASRQFDLSRLSLDAKGMFSLSLGAKLSGVDGAIFTASPLMAAPLLLASRLDRLEATLADPKLIDRLIERSARQSGVDPARLRTDYARDMGRAISVALGGSEKAKRIAAAVERFILRRSRLRLSLTAPQGLGVMDLLKSPPEILQSLEVEASAE
ncbi:hypothetical protein [Methylocystis bryophila]|uniref:Uncharacterized protein n=1 Tax=Methylocystis bryophila TaxID=655015 RepID=A0A1W6MWS3_9HYPH|nr:hypothetical protein [Methylocystis bryophila]ARN82041.1 hypothetical protein B1812_14225 [Methylocystis bryophila]BDV38163.1 hypothetical protein DSM21852_14160 [Methylocystis bryophila]